MKYEAQLKKESVVGYMRRYLRKCIAPNFEERFGSNYHEGSNVWMTHKYLEFVILSPYTTKVLKRKKIRKSVVVRFEFHGRYDIYIYLHDRRLLEYILNLKKLIAENFRYVDKGCGIDNPYHDIYLEDGFPKTKRPMSCPEKE